MKVRITFDISKEKFDEALETLSAKRIEVSAKKKLGLLLSKEENGLLKVPDLRNFKLEVSE